MHKISLRIGKLLGTLPQQTKAKENGGREIFLLCKKKKKRKKRKLCFNYAKLVQTPHQSNGSTAQRLTYLFL